MLKIVFLILFLISFRCYSNQVSAVSYLDDIFLKNSIVLTGTVLSLNESGKMITSENFSKKESF